MILGIAVFAAGAAMADITFFENENFGGRQMLVDRAAPNFGPLGFNDRAQSAIVDGRSWEVCVDANFGGSCTVLAPGRYPNLGGMSGRVSSARPVAGPGAPMPPPVAMPAPGGMPPGGGVIFYEHDNFGGREFSVNQVTPNFAAARFNDRAQSAIVEGGAWEICVDAGISRRLPNLHPRPLSESRWTRWASQFGPTVLRSARRRTTRKNARPRQRDAVRGTELHGPRISLGGEGTSNLDHVFNDQASSLRVASGYWIFCSDANFRGECRTFGPGEYPNLGPDLNNRVSSGRRISNEYPYAGNPNWR